MRSIQVEQNQVVAESGSRQLKNWSRRDEANENDHQCRADFKGNTEGIGPGLAANSRAFGGKLGSVPGPSTLSGPGVELCSSQNQLSPLYIIRAPTRRPLKIKFGRLQHQHVETKDLRTANGSGATYQLPRYLTAVAKVDNHDREHVSHLSRNADTS